MCGEELACLNQRSSVETQNFDSHVAHCPFYFDRTERPFAHLKTCELLEVRELAGDAATNRTEV